MGLHIFWDNEQKLIIRQVYDLTWTWDEYLEAFRQIRVLAAEVDYPVGLLAELGKIRSVPPNAVVYGARGIRSLPNNIVLSVMVTESQLAHSLLKLVLTAIQINNVVTAPNYEAAKQRLLTELNKVPQVVT